jgi:hypothetical protein
MAFPPPTSVGYDTAVCQSGRAVYQPDPASQPGAASPSGIEAGETAGTSGGQSSTGPLLVPSPIDSIVVSGSVRNITATETTSSLSTAAYHHHRGHHHRLPAASTDVTSSTSYGTDAQAT